MPTQRRGAHERLGQVGPALVLGGHQRHRRQVDQAHLTVDHAERVGCQGPVGHAGVVQPADGRPDLADQLVVQVGGGELRQRVPAVGQHDQGIVGLGAARHHHGRHRHAAVVRQERHEPLVLDLLLAGQGDGCRPRYQIDRHILDRSCVSRASRP